jgi:hypothetical protein
VRRFSLCLFSKDYIPSENLKIVPLELLLNMSFSIKAEINYSFTVEEVVKDMKMLVLVEFRY